jgi:hypothetical protein
MGAGQLVPGAHDQRYMAVKRLPASPAIGSFGM